MASQQRNAGAMIRASSFGAMSRELRARAGRVEESGAAPQAQSEAKAEPSGPSRRRSSSSAAERRSSGARRHSRSEPSPALPANWNDLVALSPQVILDRLTKGVEKGRCWLDPPKVRKADGTPPATRGPRGPPHVATPDTAESVESTTEVATVQGGEGTPEQLRQPEISGAPLAGQTAVQDAAKPVLTAPTAPEPQAEAGPPCNLTPQLLAAPKWGRAYAGDQSVSRIEAEAMLQRLSVSSNLDEVRRLRKLLDEQHSDVK